jgi:hypothetical protein
VVWVDRDQTGYHTILEWGPSTKSQFHLSHGRLAVAHGVDPSSRSRLYMVPDARFITTDVRPRGRGPSASVGIKRPGRPDP